jgi:hypothetical protein
VRSAIALSSSTMDGVRRPGVQIGHQTTFEAAQAGNIMLEKAGAKRSHTHYLSDITKKAENTDFARPSLSASTGKLLRASNIQTTQVSASKPGVSEYSQRKAVPATPTPTSDPRLSLGHPDYLLPERLVQNFATLGIKSIYPWQSKCLLANGLINGTGNFVYTAPTGGGKSLVADVLMLKKVIDNPEKKAILVLPYVALVQEKLRWLRSVVDGVSRAVESKNSQSLWRRRGDESSVRVVGFFGSNKSRASWADTDIAVCTIEKVCGISTIPEILLIGCRPTHW